MLQVFQNDMETMDEPAMSAGAKRRQIDTWIVKLNIHQALGHPPVSHWMVLHLPANVALQHLVARVANAADRIMTPPQLWNCTLHQILQSSFDRAHDL